MSADESKAGRKPRKTQLPVHPELDQDRIDNAVAVMRATETADAIQHEGDRDLLNQLIGQAQMADAFASFSLTVRTSKLAFVKENKLYRALKGKKTPDGQGSLSGTWDEFCSLLRKSSQHIDEDIQNLRTLGEEALDSMSRMGIGYREMRQYRRLPEDQKTALLEVAKTGDKDTFLELAEDLIAKHAREKEEAAREAEALKGEIKAKEEVLATRAQQVNTLEEKLARVKTLPADEVQAEILAEATTHLNKALGVTTGKLRQALLALVELDQREAGIKDFRPMAAGLVGQLQQAITTLRDELLLTDIVADGMPEWMRATAHLEGQD